MFRVGIARVAIVGLLISCASASAELLGVYEYTGNPTGDNQFNAVTTQPVAGAFSLYTRNGDMQFARGENIFNSGSWNRISPITGAPYTSFSFTAHEGFEVELDSLTFDFGRTRFGPTSGMIQVSTDGFQTHQSATFFDLAQGTALGGSLNYQHDDVWTGNVVWDLNDLAVDPNQTVEFRFFGPGATLNKGNLWFDNVALFSSQIPVPNAVLLGGVGLGLIGFMRRKLA